LNYPTGTQGVELYYFSDDPENPENQKTQKYLWEV